MKKPVIGYDLFHEGITALSKVEGWGCRIDRKYAKKEIKRLKKLAIETTEKIKKSKEGRKWKKRYGSNMNINSGEQLATVLYDILDFPVTRRTKKGDPSTDLDALNEIGTDFTKNIRLLGMCDKLVNTYLSNILKEQVRGYLHPVFNLHLVSTFRSCIAKGTLVKTVRGDIPIEEVVEGDYVYSMDEDLKPCIKKVLWSGKTGHRELVRVHWKGVSGYYGHTDCTPEHRIRVLEGHYVPAKDLMSYVSEGKHKGKPKRKVLSCHTYYPHRVSWENHIITRVEELSHTSDVYDIEVEDTHCFFANEICVHNSSSDPNLQNMPVRDPFMGKSIRECFIPREGNQIVEIDYSGAEVSIAASYHKDPTMIKYIKDPTMDMHRDLACECFMLETHESTKHTRYCGKNMFIFPQFYGSYYKSCAKALWDAVSDGTLKMANGESVLSRLKSRGVTNYRAFENHIKNVEDDFWNRRFGVYGQWKKDHYDEYLRKGFVTAHTGFKFHDKLSRNQVINYPVQGSAFHCLLWSLIEMVKVLEKHPEWNCFIIGQVHDSLICDVNPKYLKDFLREAENIMCQRTFNEFDWMVLPLEIEADIAPVGKSWFHKKGMEYQELLDFVNS